MCNLRKSVIGSVVEVWVHYLIDIDLTVPPAF
jgi:hypothetical protein